MNCLASTSQIAPRWGALNGPKAARTLAARSRSSLTASSRVGRRPLSLGVRCMAEESGSKKTIDTLDNLLGIEEEAPPPPRPRPTPVEQPSPVTPEPVKFEGGKSFDEGDVDFADKVLGSVCYLLPLMDGLKFSKFVIMQFPAFGLLLLPLTPVIKAYYALGFLNIAVFFGLYLGVGRNQKLSPFLRYNAMQAIVLDIFLILPEVLGGLFNGINGPPTGGPMLEAQILYYNTAFFFVYFCVAYGSLMCLAGKKASLPFVSEAAERQSGGGGGM